MVTPVIIVLDEARDLVFEITEGSVTTIRDTDDLETTNDPSCRL